MKNYFFCIAMIMSLTAYTQQKNYALINANVNLQDYANKIFPLNTVLVKNGKIESVSTVAPPSGYEIIDCQGYYLIPGMIDAHSHLDNLASAKRALETGVTTVRTAGVAAYQDVALANLVKIGSIAGPDIIAAGVYVSPNLEETVLADLRLASLDKRSKIR
ncbi:MAG: hypothetical protein U5K54_01235 [Cytophagales bacterium]|nr:hypothetical protein [Cytophagales bacterium]